MHIITDVARNATVNGQKDTGDCEATFGTNCTQAWIGAVQEARATAARRNGGSNYTNSACGDMLIQRIPDACQGYFGFSHSSGRELFLFLSFHLPSFSRYENLKG